MYGGFIFRIGCLGEKKNKHATCTIFSAFCTKPNDPLCCKRPRQSLYINLFYSLSPKWSSHFPQLSLFTGLDPEGLITGGTESQTLEPSGASRERGESRRGGNPLVGGGSGGSSPRKILKIYVSENTFQAILKPILPYSITSILSRLDTQTPCS